MVAPTPPRYDAQTFLARGLGFRSTEGNISRPWMVVRFEIFSVWFRLEERGVWSYQGCLTRLCATHHLTRVVATLLLVLVLALVATGPDRHHRQGAPKLDVRCHVAGNQEGEVGVRLRDRGW
jgi:hypothetical protein